MRSFDGAALSRVWTDAPGADFSWKRHNHAGRQSNFNEGLPAIGLTAGPMIAGFALGDVMLIIRRLFGL